MHFENVASACRVSHCLPKFFQKNNNKSVLNCSGLLILLKFLVLFLSSFHGRVKAKLCNTDLSILLLTLVGTRCSFFSYVSKVQLYFCNSLA